MIELNENGQFEYIHISNIHFFRNGRCNSVIKHLYNVLFEWIKGQDDNDDDIHSTKELFVSSYGHYHYHHNDDHYYY